MSRYIHPTHTKLWVTTHLPDGTSHDHRADGLQDIGAYPSSRDELRRQAEASGGRLDSTEADEEWDRKREGRRLYDEAFMLWQLYPETYEHPNNPQRLDASVRGATRQAHFDHVVAVLVEEFGWDEVTRDVCRAQLEHERYASGFHPGFEFICDATVVANWRLKAHPTAGRFALRMAYYGDNPEKQARAAAITRRLVDP